jgi:hypothetical protein
MFSREDRETETGGRLRRAGMITLAAGLSLMAVGCVPEQLPKQVTLLSEATAPVVDQAAEAYHIAQAVHAQRVNYDAAADFDKNNVFIPGSIQEWPPDKDIAVRLDVLMAFQLYVKQVGQIVDNTDSTALDAASKSLGTNLTTLGNSLAPTVENALGVTPPAPASTTTTTVTTTTGNTSTTTTSTDSTAPPFISATAQAGIGTAFNALGKFLIYRTVSKDLPPQIEAMDPHVQALCELLAKDISYIQLQEKLDSDDVIDKQTDFIRNSNLDPEERRIEFMKLPDMARQQRANDQKLTALHAAILHLELAHHALAAAAQGNNPETFTQKLSDLFAAGQDLAKFYSSLSSSN